MVEVALFTIVEVKLLVISEVEVETKVVYVDSMLVRVEVVAYVEVL